MARFLSWLLMIPLGAAVVVFTISNRGLVTIDFWPSPYSFEVPVFSAVLAAAVIGFLFGGIVSFLSGGRRRARNRELIRMLENSKREEMHLREQIKKLEKTIEAGLSEAETAPSKPAGLLTKVDAA